MTSDTSNNLLTTANENETKEWCQALEDIVEFSSKEDAQNILASLLGHAGKLGLTVKARLNTPYLNTLSCDTDAYFSGDMETEEKIEALVRWNAAVMVAKANAKDSSLGGHIGTFASAATIYEVGFNHFFKAASKDVAGDLLLIQGHASPGIYARSFLEGRFTEKQLTNFRKEVDGTGISSYPHPWLLPEYWQFPTVSMGLGPLQGIYQARFMKYLQHRDLANTESRKVFVFCGDGEMDEPESLGAIVRASREQLDNLIFIVNCNLQRLDGPVYGNGKIIQDLEKVFNGAGWRVIKVVWGQDWEELLQKDKTGLLQKCLEDACDGDFQTWQARGGAYIREHLFGQHKELLELVADMSDLQLERLTRGGHDRRKMFAAYQEALSHKGSPIVILPKTIKGYGMGKSGESRNTAHNQKKLTVEELKEFRDRFNLPITDEQVANYEFYKPNKDSKEMQYLHKQRKQLGGYLPKRLVNNTKLETPHYQTFAKALLTASGEREFSTTTAFVRILTALCKDKAIGKQVVPIVPDESRTFGMEGLFRQLGIYSVVGQKYIPEDKNQVMYYKESQDGQVLQEGINEAGAFCSWLAAATSYSVHNLPMIPFYIYYSMFGFQRIGDLAWAAGDSRARGFLLGGTAGRTTLNGEGLQHEDGHSHVMAGLIPNCISYDPTYAYEVAVIICEGMRRMYQEAEDVFYYITLMNENYSHPEMPKDCEEGILKGLYCLQPSKKSNASVTLLGSGTILREVEKAAAVLRKDFNLDVSVWSMTSSNELYREALEISRSNRLNNTNKTAYVSECLKNATGVILSATDYVTLYSEQLRQFMPSKAKYITLGTDGFGRSDTREKLREHFEVNCPHIVVSALSGLVSQGMLESAAFENALKKYGINPDSQHPMHL